MIHPERWDTLRARYEQERPRRLLSLDGGGIRGLISLGILQRLETLLRDSTGLPLHEFFDYIAGTSTGAIIAAGLARGMSTQQLIDFYRENGREMFDSASLLERLKYFYSADPLREKLKHVFGENTTLKPSDLRSLLLVVTKNVTTDSAWPISSNPDAKYNDPARADCNLNIPLWQLVRASTAAPVYFPPEVLQWDPNNRSKTFVFADGGITPYNNPAFLLFRMATDPAYRLRWRTGERNLLLVSIGTGAAETLGASAAAPNRNLFSNLVGLPGELMYSVQIDQDIVCRTVGRCTFGPRLDRELLDMVPRQTSEAMTLEEQYAAPPLPLGEDLGRQFLYARYNADLSRAGLTALGFPSVDPDKIQKLDAVGNIEDLLAIGLTAGRQVSAAHLGSFIERGRL